MQVAGLTPAQSAGVWGLERLGGCKDIYRYRNPTG